MMLRDGYETMSMSGKRTVPIIDGLKPDDHRFVYYYVIYPNLLLSPHPDYVLTHTAWPIAPGRTKIVCEFLFTQEALARPDFDPTDMVEFWDVTNRQDWGLCERVQHRSTVARLPPRALPAERGLRAHLRPLVRGAHGGAALGRAPPSPTSCTAVSRRRGPASSPACSARSHARSALSAGSSSCVARRRASA